MTSGEITIWGETVPRDIFSAQEIEYLDPLVGMELPEVAWIWAEMDKVWDSLDLKNDLSLDKQNIGEFYSHPVWAMNAFFAAADPDSVRHRESIALYIEQAGINRMADYGGGGAELARKISGLCPHLQIEIIEPFPSNLGKYRVSRLANVKYANELTGKYDLIVAQDVLEHIENPLRVAETIFSSLAENGIAIFANCFQPVIKCHLPSTFHLQNSFISLMKIAGFEFSGVVQGAGHAQIFVKKNSRNRFPKYVGVAKTLSRITWAIRSRRHAR